MAMKDGRTVSLLSRVVERLRLAPVRRAALPLLLGGVHLCVCPGISLAAPKQTTPSKQSLGGLSLEELGNIEVTTYSKAPTGLWDTPAAMVVISRDDILRSGATSIADALRSRSPEQFLQVGACSHRWT